MDQAAGDNELPPGLRSNLVCAVHADDPKALLTQLETCTKVELSVLLTETGGKVSLNKYDSPWSFDEAYQSLFRRIDNRLCDLLYFECGEDGPLGSLYDLAFALAAEFRSMRIVTLLLSEKYHSDVNPAYLHSHSLRMAVKKGHVGVVTLLLNDDRVDPTARRNEPISSASRYGLVELVKLLMNHPRVDPSADKCASFRDACEEGHAEVARLLLRDERVDPSVAKNEAIRLASWHGHVDIVTLLLKDKRVDPAANQQVAFRAALKKENVVLLRVLFADPRIVVTNQCLHVADRAGSVVRLEALFAATHPCVWPRVIGNDIVCLSRQHGHIRRKLDDLELRSSWMLLLCVKRIFTPTVAARVGDVLHEVCLEWTCYQSGEVEPVLRSDSTDDDEL